MGLGAVPVDDAPEFVRTQYFGRIVGILEP
jgi:hypothetical protein